MWRSRNMDENNKLTKYLVQMTQFAVKGKQKDAKIYLNRILFSLHCSDSQAYQALLALSHHHNVSKLSFREQNRAAITQNSDKTQVS